MEVRKYAIDLETMGAQHPIPEGSLFLDLQVQRGVPVMWWSVPGGDVPAKLRTFAVAVTGPPGHTENLHYVGTFQLEEGTFVGHVFSHEPIPYAANTKSERGRRTMGDINKWCVMCGAAPGEPCTIISGDPEAAEKPGDPRPEPHFYRNSDTKPAVAVKDEPPYFLSA